MIGSHKFLFVAVVLAGFTLAGCSKSESGGGASGTANTSASESGPATRPAGSGSSAANLKQISQSMLLYANENHGVFPPDLGTLLKTQDITVDAMVLPEHVGSLPANAKTMTPEQQADWANAHADYTYLGARKNSSVDPNTVLVHEKTATDGSVKVLFADGRIEPLASTEAKQTIDQSEKKWLELHPGMR